MAESIRKRADLSEQGLGAEIMIIDEKADKVHVLNATSAFIWRCLDETGEPIEIERRLRANCTVAEGCDLPGLVGRALIQFREKKLLEP